MHPPRVVLENVRPRVDDGRFPAKCCAGDLVEVTADVHADGHDVLRVALFWRDRGDPDWRETAMEPLPNDVWRGGFRAERVATYEYAVEAWIDPFRTWLRELRARAAVERWDEVSAELQAGALLVEEAAARASGEAARGLRRAARRIADEARPASERAADAAAPDLLGAMDRFGDRSPAARTERAYAVQADPPLAGFSAWYEFFPRSTWNGGGHATLRDAEARIPAVAAMGFDVLYLPPIHPIGITSRKGPDNRETAGPGDPGSPWAIGGAEGGHTAVHPALGTVEDVERLAARGREAGLEVALDLAFQCSPDHPWVARHPEWFRKRPDGTIRYAENPPKKYQDIYPLDFSCAEWKALWEALRDVVEFWIARGIRVFRVDNPHTKPYAFWEWLLAETRREHPEVVFLSEAFTRPKVMARLAKVGFHQSYTYFTWRNTRAELRAYLEELRSGEWPHFFRPNFWTNTPDILPEFLQAGGEAAFRLRAVLAATLSPSWGVYGPAYELGEAEPVAPGREEYKDSEKYEVREWNVARAAPLRALFTRLNAIRRENPAFRSNRSLRFHAADSEEILAFSRTDPEGENLIVVVANLDPHHRRAGDVTLQGLGLETGGPYQMHDLLGGGRFLWNGASNYVELDPAVAPAHVFRVRRRLRTERDFDYWL